jgi:hypothetical protein
MSVCRDILDALRNEFAGQEPLSLKLVLWECDYLSNKNLNEVLERVIDDDFSYR